MLNNKYKLFLEKNFPHSSILKNNNHIKLYKWIYKIDISTDIFLSKLNNNMVSSTLLERFRDILYRFLIIIPLNDAYSSNFYMRLITENILKIVYSLYSTNTLEDIDKIKYRHLNSKLKEIYKNDTYIKSDTDNLFSFYGKYSNEVHNKNYIANIKDMESLINEESTLLNSIFQDFCSMLTIYQKILIYKLQLSQVDLNTSQKLRFEHSLGKEERDKFIALINSINQPTYTL
ncbi:hypothetical protein [Staphylococcus sp. DORA_6_22]|uniref:Uncharacterized protein n=1 Tax=Intestinibacter bartlettii TaxID=261299 RepID=A0A6N3CPX9_9FIRM|nr:MAG: hypothetical protein Q614_SASC00307G0003 [Staphylococcus sp. DORA_6_22]